MVCMYFPVQQGVLMVQPYQQILPFQTFTELNENLYEYIDLDNVPGGKKIVPDESDINDIVYNYQQMYQLSYNNKSEVLAEDESATTKISELVLYDPYGNSPTLSGGTIERGINTGTITYTLSADAFSAASPNTFYYEVFSNELSRGAVIAKTNLSEGEYGQLVTDYEHRENGVLPGYHDNSPSTVRGIYQRTDTSAWVDDRSVIYTTCILRNLY